MEGKCCETVYAPGAWRSHICGKKAKVEVNGKLYCGIHDPIKRNRIDAERKVAYDAKWERNRLISEKSRLLEGLGKLMITTVANNGDTKYVAEDAKIKIAEYNYIVNKLEPKQEVTNED